MNIAFQALLIILFFLPGTLFIGALFGGLSKEQELPIISLSLTGRAAAALLCAGGFHGLWFLGITVLDLLGTRYTPAADKFFILLSSNQEAAAFVAADAWESSHLADQFWYFSSICASATLLGVLVHRIIEHFKLDYRISWLRFRPQWHYLLSGKYAEDPDCVVWIDALTVIDGASVVYSGLVREYWFDDKSGALDTIWIDAAERQSVHLRDDAAPSETASMLAPRSRSVQIPGSRFALRMQEIRNVNLLYISRVLDPPGR